MHEIANWFSGVGGLMVLCGSLFQLKPVQEYFASIYPDSRISHRFKSGVIKDVRIIGILMIIVGSLAILLPQFFHG